jgi:hypothetical protein
MHDQKQKAYIREFVIQEKNRSRNNKASHFLRTKKLNNVSLTKIEKRMNSPPTCLCALEAFNGSNLMGIKRRIIDIGKNYFFLFAKIVSEKYQFGYQKTQNFMLISSSMMPTEKNAPYQRI